MSGYTKLFGSILASTVWELPLATKVVWITMLAMSDRNGEVQASVPGLAKFAGVSLEQCEEALAAFMAPDRYSRTKENDGRRIEEIGGGWRLLNHGKYREQMSADLQRERDTERKRRLRAGQKRDKAGHFGTVPASPDIASASATPDAKAGKKKEPSPSATDISEPPLEFLKFWNGITSPRRKGERAEAFEAWIQSGKSNPDYLIRQWEAYLASLGETYPKDVCRWLKKGIFRGPFEGKSVTKRHTRPSGPPIAIAEAMGQRALKLAAESELERLAQAEEFRRAKEQDSGGSV